MGKPSAVANRSLSAVVMPQEKSRALLITAERPVLNIVFVISRTTPSNRFAKIANNIGDNVDALLFVSNSLLSILAIVVPTKYI